MMGPPENRRTLHLIAGSGRSGTTWMLDVLAEANELRPIFEPLHPEFSTVGHQFGYSYLTRGAQNIELKNMFAAAAQGTLNSLWTDYRINPCRLRPNATVLRSRTKFRSLVRQWRLFGKRYVAYRELKRREATIVKCIRANLMLDWIHAHFNARIVLLIRHPGAAVESRLRFVKQWDPYLLLQRYRDDIELMNGPLAAHASWLRSDFNRTEALAVIWCIENVVPIAQAGSNDYTVAFYEELLEQSEVEWLRIVRGLGLTQVPKLNLLRKPSQQSAVMLQERAPFEAYSKSYSRWRERLSAAELADISGVLKVFGVTFYDVENDRPDCAAFAQRYLQ